MEYTDLHIFYSHLMSVVMSQGLFHASCTVHHPDPRIHFDPTLDQPVGDRGIK